MQADSSRGTNYLIGYAYTFAFVSEVVLGDAKINDYSLPVMKS
jgi:hypothetical protein